MRSLGWEPCSRPPRAPITAVLIIFELTGEYSVILPLMLAIVLATSVSGRLSPDTIYTLKLRRRGIVIDRPRVVSVMRTVTVSAAMVDPPEPFTADAPSSRLVARFAEGRGESVPVVDADGAVLGVIAATDVEAHVLADGPASLDAAHLAHATAALRADDTLEEAVRTLALSDDAGMLVLAPATDEMIGWVTHRELLRAYHSERERLTPREDAPAEGRESAPPALDERDLQRDPQQIDGGGREGGDAPTQK